jgi:hypothetical protein
MLHRTPELHHLLQSVAEGHIVHHTGTCGAWPEGWSWETGGHMDPQTQDDMDSLLHAHLVAYSHPAKPCGNAVSLTPSGGERLSTWNERWPEGSAA